MKIIIAILIFSVLILFHELGHFLLAKTCGVGVTEFALGMGPILVSWGKGETKYAIKALPFGGGVPQVLVMNAGEVFYYDTVDEVFKHALELRETGLNIPTVTDILLTLKERGMDVDTDIYTPARAAQTVTQYFKEVEAR